MQSTQGELLVDPSVLAEKADNAENVIGSFQREISDLEQKMSGMNSYWKGEAAEGFQEDFSEKKEILYEVLGRFQEEIQDLRTMAGIYKEAEQSATDIAEELPIDIIQ